MQAFGAGVSSAYQKGRSLAIPDKEIRQLELSIFLHWNTRNFGWKAARPIAETSRCKQFPLELMEFLKHLKGFKASDSRKYQRGNKMGRRFLYLFRAAMATRSPGRRPSLRRPAARAATRRGSCDKGCTRPSQTMLPDCVCKAEITCPIWAPLWTDPKPLFPCDTRTHNFMCDSIGFSIVEFPQLQQTKNHTEEDTRSCYSE